MTNQENTSSMVFPCNSMTSDVNGSFVLFKHLSFSEHSKTQLIKLHNKLVKAELLQAVNMTLWARRRDCFILVRCSEMHLECSMIASFHTEIAAQQHSSSQLTGRNSLLCSAGP